MKWGIIGTGNMGAVLVTAFLESRVVDEESLYITNRTIEKAYTLQKKYPKIHVVENSSTLINHVDTIFLCVKPIDMVDILREMKPLLSDKQLLVSITSVMSIEEIESLIDCQVARMVPSITNYSLSGVTLLTCGNRVEPARKEILLKKCSQFSEPVEIEENVMRITSDMVSCGPAFFAFLAERYIKDAVAQTNISTNDATVLLEKMFIGFGKLLEDKHFTLDELIEKVCVTGGVTGVGIASLEKNLNGLFEDLITQTHHKFHEDKQMIAKRLEE
ncbi:late competence protein ComER [Gracilibacillus sp. S3-1-1]|uniref:Late competence protein ComER n=1 Tax=Gracilibacillus pellucidus TaxID=3095368 RepID=A0ACC6M4M9_9BACI|nr:late competence protein ComER [Gracilibacillus sp. S3-1-1]MDX8045924.1 late competence protein ComER [Gracilibacillus sp. S3-1-1]